MKWISVKDRLPPIHKNVLVRFCASKVALCEDSNLCCDIDEIRIGSLNDTRDWYMYHYGSSGLNIGSFNAGYVTHWMPLPEQPENDR